jgi:hypothetical protein
MGGLADDVADVAWTDSAWTEAPKAVLTHGKEAAENWAPSANILIIAMLAVTVITLLKVMLAAWCVYHGFDGNIKAESGAVCTSVLCAQQQQ